MGASTLLKRVLTASILIPCVIAAVLLLPTSYLAICFALIALLGGWEWGTLSGFSGHASRAGFVLVLAMGLWVAYLLLDQAWFTSWLLYLSAAWWLGVTYILTRYTRIEPASPGPDLLRAGMGLLVLIPLWVALVLLHRSGEDGPLTVLFLLVLIWVADSGAYFAGSRWGKRKLAPVISPGKSWEGVYGAVAGALLCGLLLVWYRGGDAVALWLLPVCVLTVLVSVVGDLFESLLKRRMAMKDSGNLLPGHGGVLDRIDSLTAAAPVFLLGLQLVSGS
jgi:phosphatidate cytidylyltransferase